MHCDALFGVKPAEGDKGWKVGLPECGLNICPGWGGTVLLPARIEPATAIAATMHGAPFDAAKPPRGLFEGVAADAAQATEAAIAWLKAHARKVRRGEPRNACEPAHVEGARAAIPFVRPQASSVAAIAVIDAVNAGISGGFDAAVEREQQHLVDLRHTPEARAKLDAFLKR